jgi:chromosome segregation ATPase
MEPEKIQAKIEQLLYHIEGYKRNYPEGHAHHDMAQSYIRQLERMVKRLRERLKMVENKG